MENKKSFWRSYVEFWIMECDTYCVESKVELSLGYYWNCRKVVYFCMFCRINTAPNTNVQLKDSRPRSTSHGSRSCKASIKLYNLKFLVKRIIGNLVINNITVIHCNSVVKGFVTCVSVCLYPSTVETLSIRVHLGHTWECRTMTLCCGHYIGCICQVPSS